MKLMPERVALAEPVGDYGVPCGREPHCARCRGELVHGEGADLLRLTGYMSIAAGAASCGLALLAGRQTWLAAGAAAVIAGVALARKRLWWRCASCGARYRRKLPPRGFVALTNDESEQKD